jgi:hypothetical protein
MHDVNTPSTRHKAGVTITRLYKLKYHPAFPEPGGRLIDNTVHGAQRVKLLGPKDDPCSAPSPRLQCKRFCTMSMLR